MRTPVDRPPALDEWFGVDQPVPNEVSESHCSPIVIQSEEVFDNQIYTVKRTARLAGYCPKTIYKLVKKGRLKAKRLGKRGIRILGSELISWMNGGNYV